MLSIGKKLEFTYDYMGRRVEKKVYTGSSTTSWTLSTHERFVYDGYKLIEKLDGANSNAILQKFLWSGDELLSVYDVAATATYYYFADANKNIGQLMDSSGNTVAKYEYSPFGVQTSATGTYAATNPFRFSSEYYDSETQLAYYNYRYYSPTLGRWLSRDPIEEEGGYNLYGFIGNNPVDFWDENGLFLGAAFKAGQKAAKIYLDADKIRREGHDKYPGSENSVSRHIYGSRKLAKKHGGNTARIMGILNEIQGFLWHDIWDIPGRLRGERDWAFQLEDLLCNEVGIYLNSRDEKKRKGGCGCK